MIASVAGATTAPPMPCTARATSSIALAGRQPAGQRGGREQQQPDHEDAPAAEEIGRAPAEQQEAGEGQRVGVDHPLQVDGREAESSRIDGSATLTTEMSRMTMNCARQVRARIQRLRAASSGDCTHNDASTTGLSSRVPMAPETHHFADDGAIPARCPSSSTTGSPRSRRCLAGSPSTAGAVSWRSGIFDLPSFPQHRARGARGPPPAAPPWSSAVPRASPSRSARATCSSFRPAPATAGSTPVAGPARRGRLPARPDGTCAAAIPPSTTRSSPTSPPSPLPETDPVLGADGPLIALWC